MGAPTFYDKLLCVPPLNLLVQPLDRAGAALEARFRRMTWTPRQVNFAHMAVWVALFAVMFTTGFVGGRHPGSDPEFWQKACESGKRDACQTWVRTLNVNCLHASGLACLTLGVVWNEGRLVPRDRAESAKNFARACDLKMPYACPSLLALIKENGTGVLRPYCERGDGESCFILASLYYAGGGVPKRPEAAVTLFRQSCDDGWVRGCGGLAECYRAGQGIAADTALASTYFEKACRGGVEASCFSVANMYRAMNDEARAQQRFQQACDFSVRHQIANTAYFRAGDTPGAAPAFCAQAAP
jgi:TPR repeat protein